MTQHRPRTSRFLPLALVLWVAAAAQAADPDPSGVDPPDEGVTVEQADRDAFYAMGVMLGRQLSPLSVSAKDLDAVIEGLRAGALGGPVRVEPMGHRDEIAALRRRRREEQARKEREASQAYLDEVARRDGVVATGTGLLYEELVAGSGASPGPNEIVEVHYHGTLRDGTVFDSSVQRGEPARFPLNRVVKCWTEGLQRMKVGGKARLTCPASLGYGDRGFPPRVPPGAALTFEVELLKIVDTVRPQQPRKD